VIKHYDGICHLYVEDDSDPEMARKLVIDAKTQKPSVCNALETLLISETIAESLLPLIASDLSERNVELRCDQRAQEIIGASAVPATDEDWRAEYLDLILSIKVVKGLDEAIEHINEYGSHHSDCIVTGSEEKAKQFMSEIDSATVFWNVSTRFSDGEEFGFGAEIGISTDKLHARGPMALRELTSYKYLITGNGQTKA